MAANASKAVPAAADFRQFVKELEDENDLLTITKEVDPHLELAAITRKVYETEDKAPLFESIKGREGKGLFRILGAPVGLSRQPGRRFGRIAKSLGLPSTAMGAEIINRINECKTKEPIPPIQVSSDQAPVKEYKLFGDDVDLTALPVPLHHDADGGKFLQTFGMHIVKTPDGRWVNWSITRAMVHDKRALVGPVIPKQDIGVISQMWKEKGQDMPWALCFGVPPAAIMASGMPIPKWTDESGFVGALSGQPVEMVKCETNDIYVPRNAEIVLEGVVSTSEVAPEGPMAEYHGMVFPGDQKMKPLFKVNAITYRHDPILPLCVCGRATEENHSVWGTMIAAEVLNICQAAGLPIKMVWCPFESHVMWFAVQVDRQKLRALKTNIPDFSRKVGHTIFGSKPGWYIPKIFLVGDDIDPTELRDIIWAESTRCQPLTNEFFFEEYGNIPLMPYVEHGLEPKNANHPKVVRCCMFPCEFVDEKLFWKEGSFRASYPAEVRDKVTSNWKAYGFDGE
ncbi:cytoplasm protein [Aspergillus sclerotialis]|uniref:Ferulic acid decarboxylase 1 n=1 Tax=Aspergillus sclerotialis TaxID=2070753 RepID=A0A3A2ZUZ1_9EURO|nr:cytoplasm protein [Aspergillus sclerotialis]